MFVERRLNCVFLVVYGLSSTTLGNVNFSNFKSSLKFLLITVTLSDLLHEFCFYRTSSHRKKNALISSWLEFNFSHYLGEEKHLRIDAVIQSTPACDSFLFRYLITDICPNLLLQTKEAFLLFPG